jgi:cobalt-zinc-cadmium efflux system membrane fusion protein
MLAAGCGKTPSPPGADIAAAQLTGNDIEFSRDNPQLGALQAVRSQLFAQAAESFTGRLAWDEDCTDRVFSPVAGQVEKVVAEVGQTVKKGDDLALMHSPDFGQAQADYRKALSDFEQFGKTLARVKYLKEHGAAAAKDVESAQADFDRGQAERDRAEANLELLGTTGGNFNDVYHLASSVAGVVVDRNINAGEQIRPDFILASVPQATSPLFTITDPTKLWVMLDIPEANLGKLHVGDAVELRTPAYPDKTFPGRLEAVGAFLDPQTRVARARASVDNTGGLLKAEMYVSVEVKEAPDAQAEVELPARAVIYEDGKYYAFVQTAARKFEKRQVALEREAGPGGGTVVVRNILPGQSVVAQGSLLLNDAMAGAADSAEPPASTPRPL